LGPVARVELGAEAEIISTFDGWTKLPRLRDLAVAGLTCVLTGLLFSRVHDVRPASVIVMLSAGLAVLAGLVPVVTGAFALMGVRELVVVLSRHGSDYDTFVFDTDVLGRPAEVRLHIPASKPCCVCVRGRFVRVDMGGDEGVWLPKATAQALGMHL
jgi:hypothetical protein